MNPSTIDAAARMIHLHTGQPIHKITAILKANPHKTMGEIVKELTNETLA